MLYIIVLTIGGLSTQVGEEMMNIRGVAEGGS